jgi:hypothetical protein
MSKKELVNILNEVFVPVGFSKKGDAWLQKGEELDKIICLQKSKYSNSYYINYGYILNSIPLDNLMAHVFKGFGSLNEQENLRINQLLDLDNTNNNGIEELRQLVINKIATVIEKVNTEVELLSELKKQAHLNDIPLVVKRYFNLQ